MRSSSGYHIISINEIRRENAVVVMQTHIRHILITPNAILIPDKARALALELRQRILPIRMGKMHWKEEVWAG